MRITMTGTAILLTVLMVGPSLAQDRPLTSGEVSGRWVLRFLPSDRPGVTIRTEGGRPPEMALSVTPRGRALSCVLDVEPADCAIRNGVLTVTWTRSSSAMTFRITDRAGDGFSGSARMRVRPMPVSAGIGPVIMVRAAGR